MANVDPESARFTLADIAYGESLIRVSAHLDNALAAYQRSDAGTALLHANRSLELMPSITRDLWRYPELSTALNQAAAGVASSIRGRRSVSEAVASRDSYDRLSAQAVAAVVPEAASATYRASVVVALLRTVVAAADAGIAADARSIADRARSLAAGLWGGAIRPDSIEIAFEDLVDTLKGEPVAIETLRAQVTTIAQLLHDDPGARLETEPHPRELLDEVARLLTDALDAAAAGDAFRADKLVARAYVERYVPIRQVLATWDEESKLNELVGTQLRRAIAAGDPIDDLVVSARDLLSSAPSGGFLRPSPKKDK